MNLKANHYIKNAISFLIAILVFSIVPIICTLNVKAETRVEINSKNFPDYNFRTFVQTNFDTVTIDGKKYLTETTLNSVKKINVNATNNIEYNNLTGISFFSNLEELYCTNNSGLTSLNVTQFPNLKILHCNDTAITFLNLSKNTELEELWCQNCKLASLDVSKNTKLNILNCRNNNLSILSVANNTDLTELSCHQNHILTLDVSKNTKLEYLSCYNNNLSALDVTKNKNLVQLYCGNNSIEKLEVNECSKLDTLDCSSNKLTALNVDKNPKLVSLNCAHNSITELSVNNNKELNELYCNGNKLSMLVLYKDGALKAAWKNATPKTNDTDKSTTYEYNNAIMTIDTEAKKNIYELGTTVNNAEMDEEAIRALVTRFYFTMFSRKPEDGAVDKWTNRLMNKESNGEKLARSFALGQECEAKKYSDEEFVKRLYTTFFDREGSAEEVQNWVDKLKAGKSREFVVAGFVNSNEFDKFCKECGIERGTMKVNNPDVPKQNNNNETKKVSRFKITATNVDDAKLTAYVNRLYTNILRRDSEPEGVEYWKKAILNGKDDKGNVYDAATAPRIGFFESKEYLNKKTSNEQFVVDAYEAFLGRNPLDPAHLDLDGYNYWLKCLKDGTYDRKTMLDVGFGNSKEFKNILENAGFTVTVQ